MSNDKMVAHREVLLWNYTTRRDVIYTGESRQYQRRTMILGQGAPPLVPVTVHVAQLTRVLRVEGAIVARRGRRMALDQVLRARPGRAHHTLTTSSCDHFETLQDRVMNEPPSGVIQVWGLDGETPG